MVAQDFSHEHEEVVFKSGDIVLEGTFVLPDSAENIPVVIFMGGIYPWGDLHELRHPFIEENMEAIFPDAGVGVFYFDPRGVEDSGGNWGKATISDFADDARAAIDYLSLRKEVDPDRIVLIGMGEDGWVAQMIGSENPDKVKAIASLSTPPFDSKKQLINEYHSQYVCAGEDSSAALEKATQKASSHLNWVSIISVTRRWKHMKSLIGFDPAPYIKDLEIPSLFVFGENDGKVYPDWARDSLNEIFPDSLPSNVTVEMINNANHFYHLVPPCFIYEEDESMLQMNFSFRFREVLRNFVFSNL